MRRLGGLYSGGTKPPLLVRDLTDAGRAALRGGLRSPEAFTLRRPQTLVRRTRRGCRVRVCGPPVKAPWPNPIEPEWMHGKRAIVEPDRKLTADGVKDRVCSHFGCAPTKPLKQDVT